VQQTPSDQAFQTPDVLESPAHLDKETMRSVIWPRAKPILDEMKSQCLDRGSPKSRAVKLSGIERGNAGPAAAAREAGRARDEPASRR
jgi:hypothetical protein